MGGRLLISANLLLFSDDAGICPLPGARANAQRPSGSFTLDWTASVTGAARDVAAVDCAGRRGDATCVQIDVIPLATPILNRGSACDLRSGKFRVSQKRGPASFRLASVPVPPLGTARTIRPRGATCLHLPKSQ
jgi:hypothetical protein